MTGRQTGSDRALGTGTSGSCVRVRGRVACVPKFGIRLRRAGRDTLGCARTLTDWECVVPEGFSDMNRNR